jgi:ribosomal protein S18 acetylase RimI-like enzyme
MTPKQAITAASADSRVAIPASRYDNQGLADIYNESRVDYIVPMPMNARRMAEYVNHYDIDLDASVVALNEEGLEIGLGMLGMRGERGWITRLGVLPHRRGHKVGQYLMERMLESAAAAGAKRVQLEVIVGNDPARRLFEKLGFKETRELMIVRRPPGAPQANADFDAATVETIADEDIPLVLEEREPGASWVEETPSLLHAGGLRGHRVTLPSGETGWAIFQRTPFQLTHFVFSPGKSDEMNAALLYHVHKAYPMLDTKVENVPTDHATWTAYQRLGYIEVFRRTEMLLTF